MNAQHMSCSLAVAAILVPLLGAGAVAQDNRQFRDWAADCDAQLACRAYTHDLGDDPGAYLFHLRRGRDEATWNLVLEVNVADPAEPYDIEAELAGPAIQLRLKVDAAAYGRESDLHLLGDDANALMNALGPASELTFAIRDEDGGSQTARFSLAGLSASLLWIDEKQGRVGSPREAGNPPEGIGPASIDAIPEEVLITHNGHGECEAFEDLPNGNDFIIGDLGNDRTLYLIPCTSGAYNFAYAAYASSEYGVERVWFADYSDYSSWTATSFIVNPDWDAATRRLTMFNKGRGIADCGSTGEWQAHDGMLRLERFTAKDDCDGEGEPGDYPVVFEAKPREG